VSITVRSYRRVFDVDPRIHRIDRWVLPVPGGLPLRTLGYFMGTLLVVLILAGLPLIGELIDTLSPPMRYVLIPGAVAALGSQVAPDGRSAHRYALTWLAFAMRSRRQSVGRAVPLEGEHVASGGTLPLVADETSSVLRRARVRGPAQVDLAEPMALRAIRGGWEARVPDDKGVRGSTTLSDAVDLERDEILEVRP